MVRVPVAIVGATGAVGQAVLWLLRDHPWWTVDALIASERSAGKRYRDVVRWVMPGPIPDAFADREVLGPDADIQAPVIFSCVRSDLARDLEPVWTRRGHYVLTNASAYRMHPQVPLMIPEINADHIALIRTQTEFHPGWLVANPNCGVSGLAMVLGVLARYWPLHRVIVTTLQAVSGAGLDGLAAVEIADNVIPWIGGEEPKLETEPKKILGTLRNGTVELHPVTIAASCFRVPVRHGHTLSLYIESTPEMTPERVREVLHAFRPTADVAVLPTAPERPILVWISNTRPQPALDRDTDRGMTVHVGRIRGEPGRIRCAVLVHNLLRGAAGAVVLNAEWAYHSGCIGDGRP